MNRPGAQKYPLTLNRFKLEKIVNSAELLSSAKKDSANGDMKTKRHVLRDTEKAFLHHNEQIHYNINSSRKKVSKVSRVEWNKKLIFSLPTLHAAKAEVEAEALP